MKFAQVLSIACIGLFIGCSSHVVTYDASGKVIGSCKATRGLLSTASASCSGSGNATGVDYNKLDHSSGLLPELPANSAISFK